MLDPIGGFKRIEDFFTFYVETSFRISDPAVAAARRELLGRPDVFATLPFVEPVLRYRASEHRLEDLVDMEGGPLEPLTREARIAFVELALSGLFAGRATEGELRRRSNYAPYRHQVDMLACGVRAGHPGIVTSGTGSGKTESLMLPILAAITRRSTGRGLRQDICRTTGGTRRARDGRRSAPARTGPRPSGRSSSTR